MTKLIKLRGNKIIDQLIQKDKGRRDSQEWGKNT